MKTIIRQGTIDERVINLDMLLSYQLSSNSITFCFTQEYDLVMYYPLVSEAKEEYDRIVRLDEVMQ